MPAPTDTDDLSALADIGLVAPGDLIPVERGAGLQKAFAESVTPLPVNTIAALRATLHPMQLVYVGGYLANGDKGGGWFYYDSTAGAVADDGFLVIANAGGYRHRRILTSGKTNPCMAGAVHNGLANDATPFNAWLTYINTVKGHHEILPNAYLFTSQVTLTLTQPSAAAISQLTIDAHGAQIFATGAISMFKITNGTTPNGLTLRGLTLFPATNAITGGGASSLVCGFDLSHTANIVFEDCVVLVDTNVAATFAAYKLRQTILTGGSVSADSGCFWTEFRGGGVRATGNGGFVTCIGVLLEGCCNATNFNHWYAEGFSEAIRITNPPTGDYNITGGISILGCWFEALNYVVRVIGTATNPTVYGLYAVQNRIENITTAVLSLEGATVDGAHPPYFGPNTYALPIGALLNNPNSLKAYFDTMWNGTGSPSVQNIRGHQLGWAFASNDPAKDVIQVNSPNNGSGIGVANAAGVVIGRGSPAGGINFEFSAKNGYQTVEGVSNQTLASLGAAGTVGRRAFITDSNATLAAGLGNVAAGGGANKVPLYDDGAAWRIG